MPYIPPDCIVDAWKTVREFSNYYNGSERPSDLSQETTRYLGHIYHRCGTLAGLDDLPPKEYSYAVSELFTIMERIVQEVKKPDSPDSDCPFAQEIVKRAKACVIGCTEAYLQALDDIGQETEASRIRLREMKNRLDGLGKTAGISSPG